MKSWKKAEQKAVRINDYQVRYMNPLYIVLEFFYDNTGAEIYGNEKMFLSKSGAVKYANKTIKKYTSNRMYKNKNYILSIKVVGLFPDENNKVYTDIKIKT